MGNKIRVELSHGGGRTQKAAGDPGACFKCSQLGHWARYVDIFLTSQMSHEYRPAGSVLIILLIRTFFFNGPHATSSCIFVK